MLPNDYDACFRKNLEAGFCSEGSPCKGEYHHPYSKVDRNCLHCPYLNNKALFEEVSK